MGGVEGREHMGNAKLVDYTARKCAIVAYARVVAIQIVEKGIRVNGVGPGSIRTPLIPSSMEEAESGNFGKEVPMKRDGEPIDVAPCNVFLAWNHWSSYITIESSIVLKSWSTKVYENMCIGLGSYVY
ncbi:hypothetical protein ACFE04_027947 [Oxalis oulophora]